MPNNPKPITSEKEAVEIFRKKFINDHNRGEERFLRGLFIEEFEEYIKEVYRAASRETATEILDLIDYKLGKNKYIKEGSQMIKRTFIKYVHIVNLVKALRQMYEAKYLSGEDKTK